MELLNGWNTHATYIFCVHIKFEEKCDKQNKPANYVRWQIFKNNKHRNLAYNSKMAHISNWSPFNILTRPSGYSSSYLHKDHFIYTVMRQLQFYYITLHLTLFHLQQLVSIYCLSYQLVHAVHIMSATTIDVASATAAFASNQGQLEDLKEMDSQPAYQRLHPLHVIDLPAFRSSDVGIDVSSL